MPKTIIRIVWLTLVLFIINFYITLKLVTLNPEEESTGEAIRSFNGKLLKVDSSAPIKSYSTSDIERARYWKWNFKDRLVPKDLVNCNSLLEGEKTEQISAKFYTKHHPRKVIHDHHFIDFTSNCTAFKEERGYIQDSLSKEEENFPIAFSILFHKDLQQVERLLRSIYRPNNIYCLHIDGYSSEILYLAAKALVRCFDNVFIVSKREKIVYAGFSRLQAEIHCMTDSLRKSRRWKYYINLASQDFPLKTNREMVKILKVYNGSNDIEGMGDNRLLAVRGRYSRRWEEVVLPNKPRQKAKLNRTSIAKEAPPHGLKLVRGSAYGVFSREFVDFIIHNQVSLDLLAWSRDTYSPDEFFWATLNHLQLNPWLNTPGGYKGEPGEKLWLAAYAAWGRNSIDPCFSFHFIHGVCIFGVEDLPQLISRKELFANKFHLHYQYLAMDCLEEYLWNRTVNPPPFDSFFYRRLPFINREVLSQPTRKPKTQSQSQKKPKTKKNIKKG